MNKRFIRLYYYSLTGWDWTPGDISRGAKRGAQKQTTHQESNQQPCTPESCRSVRLAKALLLLKLRQFWQKGHYSNLIFGAVNTLVFGLQEVVLRSIPKFCGSGRQVFSQARATGWINRNGCMSVLEGGKWQANAVRWCVTVCMVCDRWWIKLSSTRSIPKFGKQNLERVATLDSQVQAPASVFCSDATQRSKSTSGTHPQEAKPQGVRAMLQIMKLSPAQNSSLEPMSSEETQFLVQNHDLSWKVDWTIPKRIESQIQLATKAWSASTSSNNSGSHPHSRTK